MVHSTLVVVYVPTGLRKEMVDVLVALGLLGFVAHLLACAWAFAGRYGTSDDSEFMQEDPYLSWQASVGVASLAHGQKMDEYLKARTFESNKIRTIVFGHNCWCVL